MKDLLCVIYLAFLCFGCSTGYHAGSSPFGQGVDLADQATLDGIISNAIPENTLKMVKKTGGEIVFHAPNDQTPYTGWAKVTYENGRVEFLNRYKNGKLNGPYTMWYENGRMESVENYREGKLNGPYMDWYSSGQRESREYYVDGLRHGSFTRWYEDGRKESEKHYVFGKPDGTWVYFNADGSERRRETYKNGGQVK